MEAKFWHDKWEKNEIGFNQKEVNAHLSKYFDKLALPIGSRVFLPLCGKTIDIQWILAQGHKVVGSELSKLAIEQLFQELKIKPKISKVKEIEHFSAKNIDIYVGDIFNLSKEIVGNIDAVYDRAALVALPEKMRELYSKQIIKITNSANQLLICYEYDQNRVAGPPFSISKEEIYNHYKDAYKIISLESDKISSGLKGLEDVTENIWLLKRI